MAHDGCARKAPPDCRPAACAAAAPAHHWLPAGVVHYESDVRPASRPSFKPFQLSQCSALHKNKSCCVRVIAGKTQQYRSTAAGGGPAILHVTGMQLCRGVQNEAGVQQRAPANICAAPRAAVSRA